MKGRSDWDDTKAVTAGFLGGLIIGLLVWSTQIRRSRRDLFSRNPVRRLAALGYIGGHPGVDAARLLTEYVSWERRPSLRRRAEQLLRRMKAELS
ncbi:MAG TPA: hypothetical protein VH539_03100 [Gemmatimonadaceae bacterium]